MTYEEFCAVRARIDKAEALPEAERERFHDLYSGLCSQAVQYELENDLLPLHLIQDAKLREVARQLCGVAQAGDMTQLILGLELVLMEADKDFALKVFGLRAGGMRIEHSI